MTTPILIAVAWPYANGDLHAGHLAGCLLPADIFARFERLRGNDVLVVSGSDAHGTPITLAAQAAGIAPVELFTHYHERFLTTLRDLGISFDLFTHTDTANHHAVSQTLFSRLYDRGYIFAAPQQLLYSTRDHRFLPDRYVEGTCPVCGDESARGDQCDSCNTLLNGTDLLHPRHAGDPPGQLVTQIELRESEHLFLNLPALAEALETYLADNTAHWRANVRNFTRNFVAGGLKPRPISRDLDWGIPVPLPGWEEKKLYIWFENIIGYLSATIEWAQLNGTPDAWHRFWYNPAARSYYFLGKDNIPFHTIFWPAELLGAARLPGAPAGAHFNLPYDVPANEHLTILRRTLSKSRRWAIWLPELLAQYDIDSIRYAFAANLPESRDGDFTWESFLQKINGELVAKWGNLAYRVLSFAYKHWDGVVPAPGPLTPLDETLRLTITAGFDRVTALLEAVQPRAALTEAIRLAGAINSYLDEAPWFGVITTDRAAAATTVYTALWAVDSLKLLLAPYLPDSCQRLHEQFGYAGALFGTAYIETVGEPGDRHDVLRYDGSAATGRWALSDLQPGQKLGQPQPLFPKLDDDIVVYEYRRLTA
ncbi:MAG: methionine--tRNA ligase [Ardenticatenales bacterium]|nr:methionine--tRNA ligase [Ardenticatenales bacterium]